MAAGSVRYWAAAVAAGRVLVDTAECRLPLRHSHHRIDIEGANGRQTLTIPLVAATHTMSTPASEIRISEHGSWRRLHWGALFSAYGRTPYFDYVADDLRDIIESSETSLLTLDRRLMELVVDFMDLPVTLEWREVTVDELPAGSLDLRRSLGGKRADGLPIVEVPYYQVWAPRHGFMANLSVLDLMMNTGREGIDTLLRCTDKDIPDCF